MGDSARQIRTKRSWRNIGRPFPNHRTWNSRIGFLESVDIYIYNNCREFEANPATIGQVIRTGIRRLIKWMMVISWRILHRNTGSSPSNCCSIMPDSAPWCLEDPIGILYHGFSKILRNKKHTFSFSFPGCGRGWSRFCLFVGFSSLIFLRLSMLANVDRFLRPIIFG